MDSKLSKSYSKYASEPVVFIMKNNIPFAEGCIIKYVCRWKGNNNLEDLRKAKHYIDMLISDYVSDDSYLEKKKHVQ
tara:strand:+ start:558 stop:788 length:231 start_codon:yes stop_codon:yes gene_type:complete